MALEDRVEALEGRVDTLEEIARNTSDALQELTNFQAQTNEALGGIMRILDQHTQILLQHTDILNQHTDILNQHTGLLEGVVSTSQEHSIDLNLIKGYLDLNNA